MKNNKPMGKGAMCIVTNRRIDNGSLPKMNIGEKIIIHDDLGTHHLYGRLYSCKRLNQPYCYVVSEHDVQQLTTATGIRNVYIALSSVCMLAGLLALIFAPGIIKVYSTIGFIGLATCWIILLFIDLNSELVYYEGNQSKSASKISC